MACASTVQLPYADDTFDAVASLDVLYIQGVDDAAALRELYRVLRPGGMLLLNLPAWEALRGAHDRAIRTRHRYHRPEVSRLLQEAGYRPEFLSYWNTALLPLVAAMRWANSMMAPVVTSSESARSMPSRIVRLTTACRARARSARRESVTRVAAVPDGWIHFIPHGRGRSNRRELLCPRFFQAEGNRVRQILVEQILGLLELGEFFDAFEIAFER